jgi:hypothetical protein
MGRTKQGSEMTAAQYNVKMVLRLFISSLLGIIGGFFIPVGQIITQNGFLQVGVLLFIFCVLAVVVVKYIIIDNLRARDYFNTGVGFPLLLMDWTGIIYLARTLLLS